MAARTDSTPAEQRVLAPFGETIDTIWAALAPEGVPETSQRLVFSSPAGGDGTTTTALCAAIGLARNLRRKVALVEANYHSPALAAYLELPPAPGLQELLGERAAFADTVRVTSVPDLVVIPAGSGPALPTGSFASAAMQDLLERLAAECTFVLIDSPPILAHPDARHLIWNAQGVVGVFCSGRTRRRDADRWIEVVETSGTRLLGVTLNRYRPEFPRWLRDRF